MTHENFAYWLQGFNEIANRPPTPEEWKTIQEHLDLTFNKVTSPSPRKRMIYNGGFVPPSNHVPFVPDIRSCGDASVKINWAENPLTTSMSSC